MFPGCVPTQVGCVPIMVCFLSSYSISYGIMRNGVFSFGWFMLQQLIVLTLRFIMDVILRVSSLGAV